MFKKKRQKSLSEKKLLYRAAVHIVGLFGRKRIDDWWPCVNIRNSLRRLLLSPWEKQRTESLVARIRCFPTIPFHDFAIHRLIKAEQRNGEASQAAIKTFFEFFRGESKWLRFVSVARDLNSLVANF